MRFNSIFDEPSIRKLEKEFFSTTRRSSLSDGFSWPNRRSPSFGLARLELLDRREYSEVVESRVDDDEILENRERELVLKINCIAFKPEEITVTVEENQLLIEGKQERITENGKIKRQFNRKITLPEDSLTKEMNCTAKLNGLLTISIPRRPVEKVNKNEKIIPIIVEKSASNLNNIPTTSTQSSVNGTTINMNQTQNPQSSSNLQQPTFKRQTSHNSTQTDN